MVDYSSEIERFNKKYSIDNSTGCWNWIAGCRNPKTYGSMGVKGKMIDAHRVSYMLHKGEIDNGLMVLHTCDNMKCVNPDHLFLGTHQDNMDDYIKKFGAPRIGKPNPGAKYARAKKHPSIKSYEKGCRCIDCKKLASDAYFRQKANKLKNK